MSRSGLVLVIIGFLGMAVSNVFYSTVSIGEIYGDWIPSAFKVVNGLSTLSVLIALLGFVVMLVESDKTPDKTTFGPR